MKRGSESAAWRLADLADYARAMGQPSQADKFLLLAWAAYDAPDEEHTGGMVPAGAGAA